MGIKSAKINDFEKSTLSYMAEIGPIKPLSRNEEIRLWKRYKNKGDLTARDRIIKSNLKYVVKVANGYRGRGVPYSDLISEGNIGLMKALEKYDAEKGTRILTYSAWWIRQTIDEAVKKRNLIGDEDLSYGEYSCHEDSSETISGKSGSKNGIDIPCAEDMRKNDTFSDMLSSLTSCLGERERGMLEMYYGINGNTECTLDEVGKEYGLTKERVRQINEKSIKKMRAYSLEKDMNIMVL